MSDLEQTLAEEFEDSGYSELQDQEEIKLGRFPFGFASENSVLIEDGTVFYTGTPSLKTLVELRRYTGDTLRLEALETEVFQKRLTHHYQSGDNEAQQAADDMGADMDADGDENGENGEEQDVEDRVVDLEDALDELKAEFAAMMADKNGDDEEAEDYGDGEEEEWLVGFQGRPNKDSDTCYSFWLLSTIGIVERVSPWCSTMDEDDNDNGMVGADAKSIANDKKNITSSFIEWNGGCVSIEHQVNPPTNTTTTPYISFSDSLSKFTFQTAGVEVSSDKKDCTLLRTQEEMVGLLAKCPHVDHDPVHAFLGLAGVLVHPNDDDDGNMEGGRYALCEAFLKDIWGSS